MKNLADKKCISCSGNVPPLGPDRINELRKELNSDWKLIDDHHLERKFSFKNFKSALEFTNKVGALAEEEDHHPDIYLSYGKVKISIWTHKIDALTKNDFILAAKIDAI